MTKAERRVSRRVFVKQGSLTLLSGFLAACRSRGPVPVSTSPPTETPVPSETPVPTASPKPESPTNSPSEPTEKEGNPTSTPESLRESPFCVATHINSSHYSPEERIKMLDAVAAANVDWVRFDFVHRILDPESSEEDIESIKQIVDEAISRDIQVIGTLPQWGPLEGEWMSVMDIEEYTGYVRDTTELFKGRVDVWEIGNEPNIPPFWEGEPNVAEYVKYLKAAYTAIKEVNPEAVVISGGIAPENPVGWLEGMYENGAKGYFDSFGYHPYTQPGPPTNENFTVMRRLHEIMVENGDAGEIHATEVGWPTDGPDSVSEADQANYIRQVFEAALTPEYRFLTVACIYRLELGGEDSGFGLFRDKNNSEPKPAFKVLQEMAEEYGE